MAGGSTCVGASVVFCFTSQQIQRTMSFSLSLAASVMITVSVISIGPEIFDGIFEEVTTSVNSNSQEIVNWWVVLERIISLGLGCGGYVLLSKLLNKLPEPEHTSLYLFKNDGKSIINGDKSTTKIVNIGDIVDDDEKEEIVALLRNNSHDDDLPADLSPDDSNGHIQYHSHDDNQHEKKENRYKNHRLRKKRTTQSSSSFEITTSRSFDTSQEDDDIEYQVQEDQEYDKDASFKQLQKQRSWRVAMLLFVSLLAHNFPEGLAVVSTLFDYYE
jgi:zinc transporter ZupT